MAELSARPAVAERVDGGPTFGLTKFLDPLPVPPVRRPRGRGAELEVRAVTTRRRLHGQLPETVLWAYDGHFPGPTIEVERNQRLRVSWTNDVTGTMPLVAVRVPLAPAGTPPAELSSNNPGYPRNADGSPADGAAHIEGVPDVPAWLVTHLHGADANGGSDGWAHNAVLRGHSQLAEYPNRQPAASLWYHDHGMAITRWNVHAGLFGAYRIRDERERALGLPDDHDIPLLICDRNLDTDTDGDLTGQLLFKVDAIGTALVPFIGPFTLVNGVIWPHLDVDRDTYRFRLANTSNARFYRLNLINEDGGSENDAVRVIGTDGGLLPRPVPLPEAGLVLAPAERVDLAIDFGRDDFRGRALRLTNTEPNAALEPDIVQFRVRGRPDRGATRLPESLPAEPLRLAHVPDEHDQVWIALVPPGTAGMAHPQMWELRELDGDIPPLPAENLIQVTDPRTGRTRTFQQVASLFDDTVSIFVKHDSTVEWNFIHFGGPAHPMHIHLVQFQVAARRGFTPDFDVALGGTTTPAAGFTDIPLEQHERGRKDTIAVAAGEWVSVLGRFGESTGQFMYHCHILDHEDEGMMRPFVVHPAEVADFHPHRGGHGHESYRGV
ncbi:multicopper oxidase domain-containing protein [Saccharopolyspora gloriosae]|uniref:FtsP/CotA-like multicopper oxidase with cupredoxin domain n=1 Tax=Saccharopolyspora gloriosae TaxID=455344 RepID=A0A840NI61_9PSEU|nr:multicopper oxidase domain-containing protein [Saccharopolyspora gloriosae]MBB5068989.1 FtsP/CotA-like multicopper oxidase with cupredoxin domain [Saccharopolyspora gloriosae]